MTPSKYKVSRNLGFSPAGAKLCSTVLLQIAGQVSDVTKLQVGKSLGAIVLCGPVHTFPILSSEVCD